MKKKVAFVTGGSRGIGRAIVERLGKEGYTVGFSYINSTEKAESFVKKLNEKGIDAFAIKCDVSVYSETKSMFDYIYEKYGNVYLLVNNAGITRDSLFSRMSERDFDEVININLKGVFNASKSVVKHMSKERKGRIINISSLSGLIGNKGQVNYSASKAGVIGFTKSLAVELGPYSITVNAVAPGLIETDMTDSLPDNIKERIVSMIPLGKAGKPEDVAEMVSYLASEKGRYITAQVISIDGGASSV